MAQLILSQAGGYVGGQLLPQGLSILGREIAGQAIGQVVGSLAGSALDAAIFSPRIEGPRISQLHITQSVEGAVIPDVYGRMRLGCNVIWAARFLENRESSGKGGPSVTSYSYSLSFAVGLCEGEIVRVTRAWANGAPFDLSKVTWRLYRGTQDQAPDPIIEAIEGEGEAPAYRGLAYIVFEDLPLDAFGGRMPQLSFEVMRSVGGEARMENAVTGLNLIPGSGEFAYATEIIRREVRFGVEAPENMHNASGQPDFVVSLEAMLEEFPNLTHVNLVVGWFGTSTDCAQCLIHPGVERRDRTTRPLSWQVAGKTRELAYLISTDAEGRPNYGGTPDDESVRQAIASLKAAGLKVTLYPFLFMDAPGFPWRGRITCDPAIDNTSAAASAVLDFFGQANEARYRRFITHYAQIAVEAGGVDAFLIGSEMVGLTRIRSAPGIYPAVVELKTLAAEVRAILGSGPDISYAADWTEYGAYLPDDGSNTVDFPLDDLWADADIDFISLDWYPPLGDWRDGDVHLDALLGHDGPDDPAYLAAQIEGGEAYDWYYANASDRAAQLRTPIIDTAHGEDWIFRQKDVRNWWSSAHHARPGGVRNAAPTSWTPGSKPIRFIEFGCPAVDKGANQPNVFYDPKSDESALPHHSSGARDDVIQRRAIEAFTTYWRDDPMLAADGVAIWAYDMRPYPAWPLDEAVWSDGGNWRLGHWLNGRAGLALVSDVVGDLCTRAGVEVGTLRLDGLVSGYAVDQVMRLRDALAPLTAVFDIRALEREDGLHFENMPADVIAISAADIVLPDQGGAVARQLAGLEGCEADRLRLHFINSEADNQPGSVLARGEPDAHIRDLSLAVVMDRDQAQRLCDDLAQRALDLETTAGLALSPTRLQVEPGDHLALDGEVWRVAQLEDAFERRVELVRATKTTHRRAGAAPSQASVVQAGALPVVAIVDAPPLPGEEDDARPLVFVSAAPWAGPVAVLAGSDQANLTQRCEVATPCIMGELTTQAPTGAPWRWSGGQMEVQLVRGALASASPESVLNGANLALLETPSGWEMLQFQNAELIGEDLVRLSGFLRGQQGSEHLLDEVVSAGARIVFLNGAEQRLDLKPHEINAELVWRAEAPGQDANARAEGVVSLRAAALRQWAPVHLQAEDQAGDLALSWIRRGRKSGDGWEAGEPLLDGPEAWRVEIIEAETVLYSKTTDGPIALIPASDLPPIASTMEISISQLGADMQPGLASRIAPPASLIAS